MVLVIIAAKFKATAITKVILKNVVHMTSAIAGDPVGAGFVDSLARHTALAPIATAKADSRKSHALGLLRAHGERPIKRR